MNSHQHARCHRHRGSALGCPSGSAVKPLFSAAPPPQPLERVDPGFVGASFSASARCRSVLLLSLPLPMPQGRPVDIRSKDLKRLVMAHGCCVPEKQNSGVRARRQSRAGGGARGQGAVNRAAGARAMWCLPAAPGVFELTSCERAGGSPVPGSGLSGGQLCVRGRPPSRCQCVGRCCGRVLRVRQLFLRVTPSSLLSPWAPGTFGPSFLVPHPQCGCSWASPAHGHPRRLDVSWPWCPMGLLAEGSLF